MKKRQLPVLLSNIFSIIVNLCVSFFITRYLISKVGKEVYSFYPISTNVANYFGLLSMALNALSFRFITVFLLNGEKRKAQDYYASVFWTNIFLGIGIAAVMAGLLWHLDAVFTIPPGFSQEVRSLFFYAFLTFLANNIFHVFSVYGYVCQRMDVIACLDIVSNFLKIAFYVYLLKTDSLTVSAFGFSALLVASFKGMFNFFYIRKQLPDFRLSLLSFSGELILKSLRSGVWISLSNGGSMLLNSASLVVANIYLGAGESGDLSLVSVLCSIASMLISTFASVFAPRITSSVYSQDSDAEVKKEIQSLEYLNMILVVVPITILCFMGGSFYRLWMNEGLPRHLHLLSAMVMLPLLWQGMANVVHNISLTINEIRIPAVFLMLTGILNILLMAVFLGVFQLGVVGIPLAGAVSSFVYYLLLLPGHVLRRFREIRFDYRPAYWRMLFLSVLLLAVNAFFGYRVSAEIENYFHLLVYSGAIFFGNALLVLLFYRTAGKERER